jgi:hypothetical protein
MTAASGLPKNIVHGDNMEKTQTFIDLIKGQFQYGGQKYALAGNNTRESTDELFDIFGFRWLLGTCAKYCFRWKNVRRERDLLKIACYLYLIWLKRGYFVERRGLKEDILDTNLEVKNKYFDSFVEIALEYIDEGEIRHNLFTGNSVEDVDLILAEFAEMSRCEKRFQDITENQIFAMFTLLYLIWEKEYSENVTHDEDTNNASDKRN